MKILQIFGIVAAVHAGLFLFLFAVPGCRSSGKPTAAQTAVVEPASAYPDERISPSLVNTSPVLDDSSLNPAFAPASAPAAPVNNGRYTPTRPGSTAAVSLTTSTPAPEVHPVSTYTVVKGDSLWSIAKKNGITVSELAAANNLSDKAGVRIGQSLIVPGAVGDEPAATSSVSAPAAPAGRPYTVMPGDTLSGIAKKNGTTVTALRTANKLTSDMLRAGQSLTIPGVAGATTSATTSFAPAPSTGSLTHTVMPGDTLGAISRKYNVTVGDLATANNITDPTRLRVGQELKIPGWQTPPAVASKPTVAAKPASSSSFTTQTVAPATYVPEPIVPETLVPAPMDSSNDFLVPTEAPGPLVPVDESSAPRVY